nr:DUF1194 domain-containing protein [Pseudooceanicola batsensis]
MSRCAGSLTALALMAGAAAADCRLALVLALDVSASVDSSDYALQRDGLAQALNHPTIRAAILDGAPGDVVLHVFEWSGRYQQTTVVDWTVLDTPAAMDEIVARIGGWKRSYKEFPTALGYALGHAAGVLETGPRCARQVVDVSGDGINNEGFMPVSAYMHFPFDGVTVNGLVVQGKQAEVVDFYRREVLRGPGAFLETADGFEDFESAMIRKLFREINGMVVGSSGGAAWSPG